MAHDPNEAERQRALRRKNMITLAVLIGIVAVFYVVFVVRAGWF